MKSTMVRIRRGEEGSALVIALFFTVIFSILVTAVITFADVGLKSSKAYRAKRVAATGPDAAVEAAIQSRLDGAPCNDNNGAPKGVDDPDTTGVDESLAPVGGRSLVVRCQNLGVSDQSSAGSATKPRTALLALAPVTNTSEGIISGSPKTLRVRGDVVSRSKIDAVTGGMVVEGQASAGSTCTGVATDTNPKTSPQCGPTADPLSSRDPDFTRSVIAPPIRRDITPSALCSAATNGWLVELDPGYYDDADDLTALTATANTGAPSDDVGLCDGKVIWMRPGAYYFDFAFDGGSDVWTINDPEVNVVAGEPEAWDQSLPPPVSEPPMEVPGSCLTTGDKNWGDGGVEMIAGGTSQIDVVDGRMELCAPLRASEQQIALYGNAPGRYTHTLEPTAVVDADGFTSPTRAFVIGEVIDRTTDATILATDTDTDANVKLGTFRHSIPTGGVVDSAKLRFAHEEIEATPEDDLGNMTLSVLPASCAMTPLVLAPQLSGPAEQIFDLAPTCDFSSLSVAYVVNLKVGGTRVDSKIDGVAVDISYRVPETRKPTAVSVGGAGFGPDPVAAFEINERPEAVASASLTTSPAATVASITFAGFADPPLPAHTVIDSAVLRVAHNEETDTNGDPKVNVSITPTFTSTPANTCGVAQPLAANQVVFDLKACGLDEPGDLGNALAGIAGLSVTYTATLAPGQTAGIANLDGIWLELVYPQFGGVAANSASTGAASFDGSGNDGRVVDGTATTATLTPGSPNATLSLTNWSASVPAGATIDIARVRVRHQEGAGAATANATVQPAFAGSTCLTPITLTPNLGALGDDFVDLKATCGLDLVAELASLAMTFTATRVANAPVVSVDGLELQIAYSAATPNPTTTRRNATEVVGATGFGNADPDAFRIDGATSNANLGGPDPTSRSLTLAGHGLPAPLPAGTVIVSATLLVAHSETTSGVPPPTIDATVTPTVGGIPCATTIVPQNPSGPISTHAVPLPIACFDHPDDLIGFSARYDVSISGADPLASATSRIDGIVLDLVIRVPSLRTLEGCLGGCTLVKSAAGIDPAMPARFVANGTVYAPTAKLDLTMVKLDDGVLTRGVVARSISLNLDPLPGNNRPLVGVPPESVLFTAYLDGRHRPDTATSADFVDGSSPDDARDINDAVAIAMLTGPENAAIELKGFALSPSLQAFDPTTTIDSAMLRVRHREDTAVLPALTLAGPGLNSLVECTSPTITNQPIMSTFSFDLVHCGIDTVGEVLTFEAEFKATLATGAGNAELDGIVIDVYSGPLLRSEVSFERGRANIEGWSVLT